MHAPAGPTSRGEPTIRSFKLTTIVMCVLGVAAGGLAQQLHAQGYPNRPVKLIVPFAPGGTTDIVARIVSQKIQANFGQPMIVENKAGAGGTIGAAEVARATPDGYILGV